MQRLKKFFKLIWRDIHPGIGIKEFFFVVLIAVGIGAVIAVPTFFNAWWMSELKEVPFEDAIEAGFSMFVLQALFITILKWLKEKWKKSGE